MDISRLGCYILLVFACINKVEGEKRVLDMSYEYVENETFYWYPEFYLKITPHPSSGAQSYGGWYVYSKQTKNMFFIILHINFFK